jgi:AraC-like DNA-binding protein
MKKDIHLSEITESGRGTTERIVKSSADESREWLASAPVCAALSRYGIVHVGLAQAAHPYRVVRTDLSGTFIMMCISGLGQIRLEGAWKTMRAGQACLAPPHAFHAYRAIPGKPWGLVWVRYAEPVDRQPIVNARAPVMAPFDGEPLAAAVTGLHHEARTSGAPAALQMWSDLVEYYAQSFARHWRSDDRLGKVWQQVATQLAHSWSLPELARLAGLSTKQFGRLCQQTVGRTPAQHIAWLRLQQAAHLLTTTGDKVESIARSVGYQSLFTFSRKFQHFTGVRPSAYRGDSTVTASP